MVNESVMKNPTSTKFYQLIKRSRTKTESKPAYIQVDGTCIRYFDPEKQRQKFAEYFDDPALRKDQNYDNVFLDSYNMRCEETETKCCDESEIEICISEAEVGTAIDKLNSGKALDEYGLAPGHFKAVKPGHQLLK